jgi:formate-dependent nitrite reductase cytochrome c552 subunit
MLHILSEYQQNLKDTGFDGLGIKLQPHPSGRKFVGSETCGDCHSKAYEKWSTTPHAHALDSLVMPPNSRGSIARHFDPECLSCHVTGWEPQQYFPYDSGYLSLEQTPKLKHNGCENCHGPGSAHVAAENGEGDLSEEQIARIRESMKLPLTDGVAERKCVECHDVDNSPDFHKPGAFDRYWQEVKHRGKN